MNKQTEALKMAIEALEMHVPHYIKDRGCKAIQACKEALEQPAQEIVHKVFDIDNFHSSVLDRIKFTSPQQWQGLSDDEILEIDKSIDPKISIGKGKTLFARAIEQASRNKNGFSALKEKNNA